MSLISGTLVYTEEKAILPHLLLADISASAENHIFDEALHACYAQARIGVSEGRI
jgi:hypothetical protein